MYLYYFTLLRSLFYLGNAIELLLGPLAVPLIHWGASHTLLLGPLAEEKISIPHLLRRRCYSNDWMFCFEILLDTLHFLFMDICAPTYPQCMRGTPVHEGHPSA